MSVATVNAVRNRRDLSIAEKAVAFAMASHADPKRGNLCTAAVCLIAKESGMGERGARKIIRRLETKTPPVLVARTSKIGGPRGATTGYEVNLGTGEPPFSPQESDGGTEVQARGNIDALTGEPPFPQKVLKVKDKEESPPKALEGREGETTNPRLECARKVKELRKANPNRRGPLVAGPLHPLAHPRAAEERALGRCLFSFSEDGE
jgi:hypothetical protein